MKKFYTTFSFFKQAVGGTVILIFLLLFLEYGMHYKILVPGINLILLFFLVLIFRITQLIYKYQLDRVHDTNQIESTMWLYSRFTPSVSLPAMREIAGSPDFLKILTEQYYLHKPKIIVEASSGVSSIVLSEILMKDGSGAQHYSLEHSEKYANLTREKIKNTGSEILHAPLKNYKINGKNWKWYDISVLDQVEYIDMLIIDGPPETVQSLARYPAVPLLKDKLTPNTIVILDDTNRKDEQEIIKLWQQEFNFKAKSFYTEKGTYILHR